MLIDPRIARGVAFRQVIAFAPTDASVGGSAVELHATALKACTVIRLMVSEACASLFVVEAFRVGSVDVLMDGEVPAALFLDHAFGMQMHVPFEAGAPIILRVRCTQRPPRPRLLWRSLWKWPIWESFRAVRAWWSARRVWRRGVVTFRAALLAELAEP